jgi:type IV pilus assembly protein PilB
MSRLDIAEKRLPQDGRMKLQLAEGRELDLRVSTLPTLFGEKLVIRVLDTTQAQLDLTRLGYEPEDLARLIAAIRAPHGMVLVTGPTGSGKTQSLYACLNLLNTPEVNIATVEDPCEIQLQGINQVNVQDKPGLNFAVALRAFLRQDPDILMVGEVRDLETANIAIQAAQTGHLVLSTLHTNDAPATLVRLRNMGTAPYNIAASVTLITAQRLVRCLCPHCKKSRLLPPAAWVSAGWSQDTCPDQAETVFEAVGCSQCHKGFVGRTGIFQVMPMSAEMQQLVLQEAGIQALEQQARREGVASLRQAGLRKVRQGITSLDEVLAATRETT